MANDRDGDGDDDGNDGTWFAPKAFGFGLTPVAWPGWLLTIGYVAIVIGLDAALKVRHRGAEAALIAILTIGFLGLAAQHTRGGLRWRWGDRR